MQNEGRHEMDSSGSRERRGDDGHGRIQRVRAAARERLGRAKEEFAAGAASATETGRHAVIGARERATRAAAFLRDAETNVELGQTVTHRTESSIGRAGEALTRVAPSIGRGTERAAEKLGEALQAISHPTGVLLGSIAGRLGGLWRKAAEERRGMPRSEDGAMQNDVRQVGVAPSGLGHGEARPGYGAGHVTSTNPDFDGRDEEFGSEFRERFRAREGGGHDSSRDHAPSGELPRYGHERGNTSES